MSQVEQSHTQEISNRKSTFETKIAPALQYVGAIGACLMVIAYVAVVFVLINGFKVQNFTQTAIFAIINGIVGLIICQFLKIQGVSFAESLDENKSIITQYYTKETKDKKYESINSYWVKSIFKDVAFKLTSISITSAGLIYIVIEGSNDYSLLLLALVNLIMFICFGLLGLVSAYNFYNNKHVPYMIHQLNLSKTNQDKIADINSALNNLKEDNNRCLQTIKE